jgi:heterodisulfide reductase subunit C
MDLITEIESLTGQPLRQALTTPPASVPCPVKAEMGLSLKTLAGQIADNKRRELLSGRAIWACTGCRLCDGLLGSSVDFSRVIDALRQIALAEGHGVEPEATFYESFLSNIRHRGRLSEWTVLRPRIAQAGGREMTAALVFKGKLRLTAPRPGGWKPFKAGVEETE